jgi:hypothetical protein
MTEMDEHIRLCEEIFCQIARPVTGVTTDQRLESFLFEHRCDAV